MYDFAAVPLEWIGPVLLVDEHDKQEEIKFL